MNGEAAPIKDPVDLQLASALKEMVARGLIPPPEGPGGINALAEGVSRRMLGSPFGRKVRDHLAEFALTPQPGTQPGQSTAAESLAAFIHSLALAHRDGTGALPS